MRFVSVFLALVLAAATAFADFSYRQETEIVGGSLAGPMKMGMKMSKTARDAMTSAVSIKGNRMATRTGDSVTIFDLDAETITTIDNKKSEYSVMTFAEMGEAMKRMTEKMNSKQKDGEFNYKVDIRDGKKSQDVHGYPAKLTVISALLEGSDNKGNSGAMEMVNDVWVSTSIAGSDEMVSFSKRLAEKMAGVGGLNMGAMAGMMKQKGFEEAMKKYQENAANLQGVPVLTIVRMAPAGGTAALDSEVGKIPAENAESDDSGDKPSVGGVLRGMGGFGGFGRKKNDSPSQPQAGSSGTMIELAVKTFDFSTATVDGSVFAIPAGYKQVENPMKKALR